MIVSERDNQPVFIGYVGENNSRPVSFYVGDIIAKYPDAVFSLIHKRKGDPDGYPVSSEYWTVEGNTLTWRPQSGDLAEEGIGELQIKASNDGDIIKTKRYKTDTHGSLGVSADPPAPWESWIEQVEDAASAAEEAASAAEEAAVHQPIIDENGYWNTWDQETGEYVATETKAQGEAPIDDTTPAANKVYSSNKVEAELTPVKNAIQDIEEELDGQQSIDTKSINPDSEWSNGGVQAAVGDPIAFTTSSSYRYAYYEIDDNDISFTVTTHQSTSSNYPKYVHFVNSSNVVLSAVGNVESAAGDYTYSDIPIPDGAVKMYVTFNGTNPAISPTYSVTKKYYSENVPGIVEKVDEAVSDVKALKDNVGEPENVIKSVKNKNIVNGGLKGEAGGTLSETVTSSYYNVTVNVESDANKYIIRTKQSNSSNYPHYFWFVDDRGIILLAGGEVKETADYYTYIVDNVPEGAKTLSVLTGGGADNIIIKKEVTVSIRSEMNDIEHYFDKKGLSTSPYADELKDEGRATVFGYNFSRKCLNFAFITDTHFGGTRYPEYDARNNMRAFADMANERWLDFAAHGGDIITDYGLSRDEAIEWMDDTLGIFGDIQIPVLIAKGNHEANSAYYQLVTDTSNLDWNNNTYYVRDGISFASITEDQWNGADDLYVEDATPERIPDIQFTMLGQLGFAGDVVRNSNDYLGGYFYKDFDYNKIRVIVLDEYQIRGTTWIGMSSDQLAWLGGTALMLGDKADYSVMIISHSQNVSADVVGLINAYQNGTSYTISGETYDFTSQGEKPFIMYLHGHEHNDTLVTTDGFNNIGVTCGFVPAEKVETEEEIRFSIFTIDTTERKIYETRIGYGSSREFSY